MLMTNGFGAWIGTYISGRVVDHFTANGIRDWHSIWISFAAYALALGVTFPLVFRYKHDPATPSTAFQH
jgi:NHS family xanthosine MFS transporter